MVEVVTPLAPAHIWPFGGYDEIALKDGGTITGKVTMTGGKPTPKGFHLITFFDPVCCGWIATRTGGRILEEFGIEPDGGLKDVVVKLTDEAKRKPFKFEPPTIEARDGRFLPLVTVVRDKAEVTVVNMDPVTYDYLGV